MSAYGLTIAWRLEGDPEWIKRDTFDVSATFPPATSEAEVFPMLKTLLDERFHLVVHREERQRPVYALTIAKGGLKIREAEASDTPPPNQVRNGHIAISKATMQRFADLLATVTGATIDRPVLDTSGMMELFDFALD